MASPASGTFASLSLFAAIALGLAAMGLYGIIAFSVERRTREVGVRMAVGATRGEILRLIVRQGARLMLVGVPLGILFGGLAFSIHRAQSLMHSVSAWDLPTLVCVVALVGLIGLGASLLAGRGLKTPAIGDWLALFGLGFRMGE